MKSICIFCGSQSGNKKIYAEAAVELGNFMVQAGLNLIYGGASVGLMGLLADTVLKKGGQVFGVIPQSLQEREVSHPQLTKLYVVDSMHQRKQMMFDLSDAFVALPGGLGTLEELCEILTWSQLGLHKKPCGVLNTAKFFDPLAAQLDLAVAEGFMSPEHREMLIIDDQPKRFFEKLRNYEAPTSTKWIGRKQI